ncbi:MAG TPA: hypothetical protein VD793_09900 [Gemmatimonadales bacterium]|nr:hypothetical protein [Gemmatimonadales bacterium]
MGARLESPTSALGAIGVGAVLGATLGAVGWWWIMARRAKADPAPPSAESPAHGDAGPVA